MPVWAGESEETAMSKVIAIFGAGVGLGASVARRFAREGFRIALVARRKDRLDALVEQLSGEGVDVAGFTADLSEPDQVPAVIEAIRQRFGRIDVIEYGPISGEQAFSPATQMDAATLRKDSPLLLLTPVEVIRAVLGEWTERGDGAFLMTTGHTAVEPRPYLSGVGPLMAAARNWLYSLNGELADIGAYAGTLTSPPSLPAARWAKSPRRPCPRPPDRSSIPTTSPTTTGTCTPHVTASSRCIPSPRPGSRSDPPDSEIPSALTTDGVPPSGGKTQMNAVMWVLQSVLAALFAVADVMKSTLPIPKLAGSLPYVKDLAPATVRFIGIAELAGALGPIPAARTITSADPPAASGVRMTARPVVRPLRRVQRHRPKSGAAGPGRRRDLGPVRPLLPVTLPKTTDRTAR
ncbi:SDR family NAD(P)-dependent oxidoreductase [Rhodococcus sp. WB9]|uniref:SDR family NAD(P)-dependent oxidoreductase n=1 Tax=Rhodococcus sp. WB9 TaxID=2594007 RepID=UPI0021B227A9|nr:SDR family NAD(P)-dependent oxidoreductase [Rhodococcus sp. WB9]